MYNKNPYIILGISKNASNNDIKKAYKKIALENHPDKHNDDNDNNKQEYINKFIEATEAYNYLINDKDIFYQYYEDEDIKNWKNIWEDMIKTKDIFKDIAKIFIDNNLISKKNKNIYKFTNTSIKHNIKLYVTYNEVYNNLKKKLRLILKDINEPIFIDILCGVSYPNINRIYVDDDDVEHDILINLKFLNNDNYSHVISKNDKKIINLIYNIELNLIDYLEGYNNKIHYIDNNFLDIYIPPFNKELYEIKNKGINGGSLIFKINYKDINFQKWNILSLNDKMDLIRILHLLF